MKTLRCFFKLASPFWFNRRRLPDWILLTAVIGFALAIIRVSVLITEWNKTFYDALADFNGGIMPQLIITYLGYISLIVAFIVCGNWLRKVLVFRWREHLTGQFHQLWLEKHKHYRLQLSDEPDNPDQRIAEDIYQLADKTIALFKYFIMNATKLAAFVAILWQLSGTQSFRIGGIEFVIRGYLVWVAFVYSVLCTWFMHLIGHKLQELNVERQHREADYRATLLRVRDNAEQIAFYQGEARENARLTQRFMQIKQNWAALIRREFKIETFSATYLRLGMFIPIFATLPMYLARTMTFGDMMQARSAFANVQDGFGWFMDYYKRLIEWAAVVERLAVFQTALVQLDEKNSAVDEEVYGEPLYSPPYLQTVNLTLHTAQGRTLLQNLNLQLQRGDWLLLDGKSGIGKSTLLRTLAGLWPYYRGEYKVRSDSRLFLPQKPYLPHDSLRAVLSYPAEPVEDDAKLREILALVGLRELGEKLDESREWHYFLSGGEQQRISLARAFLHQPTILFLDESTNQLDEESALSLIKELKNKLPDSLCLAVSHQLEVKKLFNQRVLLER